MKVYSKKDFPVANVRKFLEPGPIVLVSSCYKDEMNIMTMGWHTIMEFSPSLIGCYIWNKNHSYDLIKKSKACVINIPTVDIINKVVAIGNTSGTDINKFEHFELTPIKAHKVAAPLIKECYANLECKLYDAKMIKPYNFFIFEVVKVHAPTTPKYPKTIHYTGDGIFMVAGGHINLARKFKPEYL